MNTVHKVGYRRPTNIQKEVIPRLCAGKDVVAMARTGSGKVRTVTSCFHLCDCMRAETMSKSCRITHYAMDCGLALEMK